MLGPLVESLEHRGKGPQHQKHYRTQCDLRVEPRYGRDPMPNLDLSICKEAKHVCRKQISGLKGTFPIEVVISLPLDFDKTYLHGG
jgi:hypothetical protein